ncbi:MAG: ATP-binding protein [Pseudomonadota bacterium]
MPVATPTLHMICGKIASGKSTLAAKLASASGTVLISEDAWLSALFSDQLTSPADYVRCTARLRSVLGPHVTELLKAGVSIVLDFAANTVEVRKWMRGIIEDSGAKHRLHVLEVTDEACLARLRDRNAEGAHEFAPTEAQFRIFMKHFALPTADEGFIVIRYGPGDS